MEAIVQTSTRGQLKFCRHSVVPQRANDRAFAVRWADAIFQRCSSALSKKWQRHAARRMNRRLRQKVAQEHCFVHATLYSDEFTDMVSKISGYLARKHSHPRGLQVSHWQ